MFKTIFLIVLISFFIFKFFLYIFLFLILMSVIFLYTITKSILYVRSIDRNEIEFFLKAKEDNSVYFENILNKKAKKIFKYNKLGQMFFKNLLRNSLLDYIEYNKNSTKKQNEIYKYFEIFEFNKEEFENINMKELKRRYKNLSKKYHPDIKGGSHQKMSLLNNAYEYFYNFKTEF